jgi:hypothetical protein
MMMKKPAIISILCLYAAACHAAPKYDGSCMQKHENLIVPRPAETSEHMESLRECAGAEVETDTKTIAPVFSKHLGTVVSNTSPAEKLRSFSSHAERGSGEGSHLSGIGNSIHAISDKPLIDATTLFASVSTWTALREFATVDSQNLGSIRFAEHFPGGDWCAKVTAADADLGNMPGEIWINHAAGQSACAAAPILSTSVPRVLRFIQPGTYPIRVGWTLTYAGTANSSTSFISPSGTQLLFTGSAGLTIDGTATVNGARNIYWENLAVYGNAKVNNGLTLRKVMASTFVNLKAGQVSGVAILCQFCVLDTFIRPKVSTNESDMSISPAEGIKIDWISGAANASNENTLVSPVMEGITRTPGIGIHVAHAGEVNCSGGSSEGNTIGIQVDASFSPFNFGFNSFNDLDLEFNTVDILDNGVGSQFLQIRSTDTAIIGASAVGTRLLNGTYNQLTIVSGATGVHLEGLAYNSQTTGAIADGGTGTTRLRVYNIQTGVYDPDVFGTVGSLSTSGQIASTLPTGISPFSVSSTTPVTNLTVSNHPIVRSCGTAAACSPTALTGAQIVQGSVALIAGTPSTATVTGISPAFKSTSSYKCTLANETTASNAVKVTYVSGSSFTITGPDTVADVINYICVGN